MTNYADYPTTERFWRLVEKLEIEGPKCIIEINGSEYQLEWNRSSKFSDGPFMLFAKHPTRSHGYLFPALDPNALLSWEWLTKPRGRSKFHVAYGEWWNAKDALWVCGHKEYEVYFHDMHNVGKSLAQALAEYAISLMEYERGEK